MSDVEKDRGLTTSDLANAARSEARRREDREPVREDRAEPGEATEPGTEPARREVPIRGEEESTAARGEEPTSAPAPLFTEEETAEFRREWDVVQIGFVDEPRGSVERADQLVARMIQRLAELFADERGSLERQWDRGDQVSTEDLRVALQRYRSFFSRLLSV
jgi:hypothetical protein